MYTVWGCKVVYDLFFINITPFTQSLNGVTSRKTSNMRDPKCWPNIRGCSLGTMFGNAKTKTHNYYSIDIRGYCKINGTILWFVIRFCFLLSDRMNYTANKYNRKIIVSNSEKKQ